MTRLPGPLRIKRLAALPPEPQPGFPLVVDLEWVKVELVDLAANCGDSSEPAAPTKPAHRARGTADRKRFHP